MPMKRIIRIYLLLGITLTPCFRLLAQELRTGIDFDRMILPKVEFLSKLQLRKSFVGQNPFYIVTQAGLEYKIIKQLSIAGSFRYSLEPLGISENSLSPFSDKMRYTAETKVKSKRFDNGVRLRYRLRYQHSETQQGKSKDYLRNKLMLDYKLIKEMTPYAAAELYFRLGENELQKFRLYLGADFKLFKREAELSYILEGDFDDTYFLSYHMIGVFFRI
ncbi:MAG: hypothetical protein DRJ29_05545 [Bacteroidetes bacterium]|nr:MAG: hypothetical protein DRI98_06790 [Bacteroidota bacterium]RLD94549.1 MAG: hypothetical protein DRJ29_05545 [Bacteroidota bacterium]RLE00518.1 MAG: hypothetical protein DRJ13_08375 [Bacteroidota bacterium]